MSREFTYENLNERRWKRMAAIASNAVDRLSGMGIAHLAALPTSAFLSLSVVPSLLNTIESLSNQVTLLHARNAEFDRLFTWSEIFRKGREAVRVRRQNEEARQEARIQQGLETERLEPVTAEQYVKNVLFELFPKLNDPSNHGKIRLDALEYAEELCRECGRQTSFMDIWDEVVAATSILEGHDGYNDYMMGKPEVTVSAVGSNTAEQLLSTSSASDDTSKASVHPSAELAPDGLPLYGENPTAAAAMPAASNDNSNNNKCGSNVNVDNSEHGVLVETRRLETFATTPTAAAGGQGSGKRQEDIKRNEGRRDVRRDTPEWAGTARQEQEVLHELSPVGLVITVNNNPRVVTNPGRDFEIRRRLWFGEDDDNEQSAKRVKREELEEHGNVESHEEQAEEQVEVTSVIVKKEDEHRLY